MHVERLPGAQRSAIRPRRSELQLDLKLGRRAQEEPAVPVDEHEPETPPERILEWHLDPPVVVIAPDRRKHGTNALLISPAGLIDYDFGPDSYQRHCDRAKAVGARLEVVTLPSLGLDLDLPEDLEMVRKLEGLDFEEISVVEESS